MVCLCRDGCGKDCDHDARAGNRSHLVRTVLADGSLLVALGTYDRSRHLAWTTISAGPCFAHIELGRTPGCVRHH